MNLVFTMFISIFIKAISAIVEIAIQMLITNRVGVSEYGNYAFFVSLIDGGFFFLFSSSIKLNSFYLSTPSSSLKSFKKKFLLYYILPIISVMIIAFIIMRSLLGVIAAIAILVYYFAHDTSSVFLSRGLQIQALLGEYLFGRIVLLIGVFSVIKFDVASSPVLLCLYGIQFLVMLIWFAPFSRKIPSGVDDIKVPIRLIFEYQISDVASSLIAYSPTILQYIFGGAFTAGFTGIVSLTKKFINFISGPTAKVFLPEFSRLYKNNEREELEKSYLMIVRLQMVFIGTVGAVLIGFPRLVLHLFSPELEQYCSVFTGTAICLLLVAGIGPVTGLLQMTGNEKLCNRDQWISILSMCIIWFVFRNEPLFAVYGLCVQAVIEGLLKYISVCRWFGKNIISFGNYVLLWLPVAILRIFVELREYHYSYIALFISVLFVFCWNSLMALRDPMIRDTLSKRFKSFKK